MKKLFTGTILVLVLTAASGFTETNQAATVCAEHLSVCPKCGFVQTNQAAAVKTVATNDWKASVYGGFAAKSGNTTSSSYNYGGEFSQDGKVYRGKLKLDGSYSKAEKAVTTSQSEASGELRRMLNERWFVYGTLSALHDEIRDVSYRVKTGPGLGYYFVDTKELKSDVSSGPLYVQEKEAGTESDYLAWRFAQGLDWQITERFRWWVSSEVDLDTTDTSSYIIAFKTGIESKINSSLSLLVMVKDDYDSKPEAADKIEKNDVEISTGLRYAL